MNHAYPWFTSPCEPWRCEPILLAPVHGSHVSSATSTWRHPRIQTFPRTWLTLEGVHHSYQKPPPPQQYTLVLWPTVLFLFSHHNYCNWENKRTVGTLIAEFHLILLFYVQHPWFRFLSVQWVRSVQFRSVPVPDQYRFRSVPVPDQYQYQISTSTRSVPVPDQYRFRSVPVPDQ